ncbi:putative Glutamate receptor 2-like 19, partial [Homarus americanus]
MAEGGSLLGRLPTPPTLPPTLLTTASLLDTLYAHHSLAHAHIVYLAHDPPEQLIQSAQVGFGVLLEGMDDEEKDLASLGVTLITPILGEPLAILKETKTSLQDNRTNRGRPETPPRTPEEVTASPGKSQTSLGKVRIMPLEVHRDVDEVVNLLKERPNQYSRATVVLYGSGDYLSKAVKQAVGADVVTPGQVWVLVSEGSLHHYSRFLVTHTLTSQFNLLLVTQVTKTHQDRSP